MEFGNGSGGMQHQLTGYVLPKSGRLIGMGLSLNLTNIKLKVVVTINQNQVSVGNALVTKDFDNHSGYTTFQDTVDVSAGSRINFMTRMIHEKYPDGRTRSINSVANATGVVSLLIVIYLLLILYYY